MHLEARRNDVNPTQHKLGSRFHVMGTTRSPQAKPTACPAFHTISAYQHPAAHIRQTLQMNDNSLTLPGSPDGARIHHDVGTRPRRVLRHHPVKYLPVEDHTFPNPAHLYPCSIRGNQLVFMHMLPAEQRVRFVEFAKCPDADPFRAPDGNSDVRILLHHKHRRTVLRRKQCGLASRGATTHHNDVV